MGLYSVAVVGVSFDNEDGSRRQDLLAKVREGEPVQLERDYDNLHDVNAVRVMTGQGCIGMIGRGDAWVCERIDADRYVVACIDSVGPADNGLLGAVLRVSTDAEIDVTAGGRPRPFGDGGDQ